MSSGADVVLRVLFFREQTKPDVWVAQALELDIAAYGPSVEQAKRAFERTVSGYMLMADRLGQVPFATLRRAPSVFWDVWKSVAAENLNAERMPSVDTYMLPVVTNDPLPAVQ